MTHPSRSGGQILVDALKIHGVDTAFGVPGESYLDVLDALHGSGIDFVINRQEGGAAFMADAYGKLTGRPGICFVTRGPGATNAAIGVHTAFQDSTPMILFIGQVGLDFMDREAFQEIDYRRMYGQMAKWVTQIDRAERIPEYIARAFQVATSGRPGPVVLALPEDMLITQASVADTGRYQPVQASPAAAQVDALRTMLAAAQRPIVLLGGGTWNEQACADLVRFAEANALPVGCTFRFQDLLDNEHPHYAGDVGIGINPKLAARVKNADLIIAIGPRLGEMTTGGYALLEAPVPKQRLVHIHADAEELGSVYQAELMINSGAPQAMAMLAAMNRSTRAPGATRRPRRAPTTRRGSSSRRSSRMAQRRSTCGKWCRSCRRPRRPTPSSPTAPAITRPGRTASSATARCAPSSRRPAGRWAMACQPGSRRRSSIRRAPSSPSPATANS
jgi:acetolactate synthase-1/2/3 large subunit